MFTFNEGLNFDYNRVINFFNNSNSPYGDKQTLLTKENVIFTKAKLQQQREEKEICDQKAH